MLASLADNDSSIVFSLSAIIVIFMIAIFFQNFNSLTQPLKVYEIINILALNEEAHMSTLFPNYPFSVDTLIQLCIDHCILTEKR